jgi:transcriptional regulator with XRE-family HTH domain
MSDDEFQMKLGTVKSAPKAGQFGSLAVDAVNECSKGNCIVTVVTRSHTCQAVRLSYLVATSNNLMPLDLSYLERLRTWVEQEIASSGSQNKLAERLGVKHQTLIKWKTGNLKNGLDDSSIGAIAQYRCESPDATRAWLEGRTLPIEDPLLVAIQNASLPSLIAGMKAIAYRLDSLLNLNQSIASLIEREFQSKGKSLGNPVDFMEFFQCGPFDPEDKERIHQVATGKLIPERDDLPDLAIALEYFSGKPYSEAMLYQVWRSSSLGSRV